MKRLWLPFCFILLISCSKKEEEILKPYFLIGNWKRLNDSSGKQTYERWSPNFEGIGYTLENGKKTFSETLKIITINDTLHLEVIGVNKNPTFFKFISQTDSSFVCENPKNEFPKKISYSKVRNNLKATVWNDDFSIDFIFEKENKSKNAKDL